MHRNYLTIVSGLPRSGTSMMMRLLAEGGIPVLTDHVRSADEDNPRGYYEYEPVKETRRDPSWVPGAVGRVVKMVHLLLLDLPLTYSYRVVFMRRNLLEVVRSQDRMLQRLNRAADDLPKQRLLEIYQAQVDKVLAHLHSRSDVFHVVQVDYNEMMRDPLPQVKRLSDFLGGLDVDKALGAVELSLYRNRCGD